MFSKARLSIKKGATLNDKYKLFILAAYTSRKGLRGLLQPLISVFTSDGMIKVNLKDKRWKNPITIFLRITQFESDYLSMAELILFNCYRMPVNINPDLIIDGGGNTGIFTLMSHVIYPEKKVLLFEPVQDNLTIIKKHMLVNRASSKIHEGILTLKTGVIPFYLRNANNSSDDPAIPYSKVINIQSFNLCEILSSYKFNSALIKLDIEGSEIKVIPSLLEKYGHKNLVIVGELHDWPEHLDDLNKIVEKNNYSMTMHDQDDSCLLFHISRR